MAGPRALRNGQTCRYKATGRRAFPPALAWLARQAPLPAV